MSNCPSHVRKNIRTTSEHTYKALPVLFDLTVSVSGFKSREDGAYIITGLDKIGGLAMSISGRVFSIVLDISNAPFYFIVLVVLFVPNTPPCRHIQKYSGHSAAAAPSQRRFVVFLILIHVALTTRDLAERHLFDCQSP